MGSARRAPVERLVEFAVAIPVSVATAARQLVPVGVTRLERRIARDLALIQRYARRSGSSPIIDAVPPVAAVDAPAIVAEPPPVGALDAQDHDGDVHLAIDGYDQLSARQIVDRLPSLTADELAAVDAYERSHRRRQTVLARIAQLP